MKDQSNLSFGLAHVFVEQLGTLDIEEVRTDVSVARQFCDLLGQGVRHGLGDERLTASWWSVEQDALRCGQLVILEECTVQVRQFHGVGDRLDLFIEAPDVGVANVGNLFEHQFFGFLTQEFFHEQVRAEIEQKGVATA